MSDPQDNVEFSWRPRPIPSGGQDARPTAGKRFLSVWFRCCHVYGRIYRNTEATRYEGRCPRCGAYVHAGIGENGTSRRLFEAN